MVRIEVLRRRLNQLEEYLEILHGLQRYSFDAFLDNPEHYGSAERFLHLAIESLMDMGNHVVAHEGLGVVDAYSDIAHLLYEAGYVDAALHETWVRMIGFRNILVHGYLDIDREIVYRVLCDDLADIEALRDVFARFL